MEEKIKISIPSFTKDILLKDCANFSFYKDENTINKNLFINTLIVNYYEKFSNDEKEFHDELASVLIDNMPTYKEEVLEGIIKVLSKRNKIDNKENKTVSLSFKPTKISSKTIEYINNILITNESISSYYRRLLTSYVHKPMNERELIIFNDIYKTLLDSINKKQKVCIFLNNKVIYKDVSVYAIEASKDELFNYVLFVDSKNTNHTIRINKIRNVTLSLKKSEISEDSKALFDKQIRVGVQYPTIKGENETIIIKLTNEGKSLFKKLYLYRPVPIKIEGDLYYFDCSYQQANQYFRRFGKNAIVIAPAKLGISIKQYFKSANKEYRNIFYKD